MSWPRFTQLVPAGAVFNVPSVVVAEWRQTGAVLRATEVLPLMQSGENRDIATPQGIVFDPESPEWSSEEVILDNTLGANPISFSACPLEKEDRKCRS